MATRAVGFAHRPPVEVASLSMFPFGTATAALRYSPTLEGREPAEAARMLRLRQRLLRGGDRRSRR
jgi:hypothetical protein